MFKKIMSFYSILCLFLLFSYKLNAMEQEQNELLPNYARNNNIVIQVPPELMIDRLMGPIFKVPVGAVIPFAGRAAPEGWLLCYGQSLERVRYPDLYAVIQDTFGGDNTAGTFNVPDLRGRSIFGEDGMGGPLANVITTNTVPQGSRVGAIGGREDQTLHINHIPNHTHTTVSPVGQGYFCHGGGGTGVPQVGGGTSGSSGGGQPHSIMPPFMIMNQIIKY